MSPAALLTPITRMPVKGPDKQARLLFALRIWLPLIAGFFVSNVAVAQTNVYHPFPESNAFWCQTTQGFDGMCDHTTVFTSYFGNDTVINSTIYHQVRQAGYTYSSLCGGGPIFNWCCLPIRQDSALKMVYYYDLNTMQEKTMYNFNLQPGDTLDTTKIFWTVPDYIVTATDSILINGQYRKRFIYNGCQDSTIIEGIGGDAGLYQYPSTCFEYYATLNAFRWNGVTLYPDTGISCTVLSTPDEMSNPSFAVTIHPNPLHTTATIRVTGAEHLPMRFSLYTLYGVRAMFRELTARESDFYREGLPNGMYIYRVETDLGVMRTGKLILY